MASFDSLPYIDADISESERRKANALVNREISSQSSQADHHSLFPLYQTRLPPLFQAQLDRLAAGESAENGIDLARYEAGEETSADSDVEALKRALKSVYTNTTYLEGREVNISLLEDHGKNAWLIGNAQLEALQKQLESRLSTLKEQSEHVNRTRKGVQENSKSELLALEDTWKRGIGRIIETQLATNDLKRASLKTQSHSAQT